MQLENDKNLMHKIIQEECNNISIFAKRLSTLTLYAAQEEVNIAEKKIMCNFLNEIANNLCTEIYNYISQIEKI